ncbi:hypothetical protein D1AOALGA4SA_8506 [Olavius algarvensis Delta 1 endosymbiont]|nr:hypothetical protein D1AOALGA4SA_8506 [Olavius algarvensis Delta 1 endosymbiont]
MDWILKETYEPISPKKKDSAAASGVLPGSCLLYYDFNPSKTSLVQTPPRVV